MKKIVFLTGTRADFGKLKTLISRVEASKEFSCTVFVTGMHMLKKYGLSALEIEKQKYSDIYSFINQREGDSMDHIAANTVHGIGSYLHENPCDLLVIHGDRVEALAGALVGALTNIRIAHIEGGELSGTVDELIRHAVTKMAHSHFVANEEAQQRLIQMGEDERSVFVIGSPEVDIMLSDSLPSLEEAKERYDIMFDNYALSIFHPVTTERHHMEQIASDYFDALEQSKRNYLIIYPNNDVGNEAIFRAIEKHRDNPRFLIYPSTRFEYFLTLLNHCQFIIGNSSVGVREAPIYGVPTINVGTRQNKRNSISTITSVDYDTDDILKAIRSIPEKFRHKPDFTFGLGDSHHRFMKVIEGADFWSLPLQKSFIDRPLSP